jgi:hypothetical protein
LYFQKHFVFPTQGRVLADAARQMLKKKNQTQSAHGIDSKKKITGSILIGPAAGA